MVVMPFLRNKPSAVMFFQRFKLSAKKFREKYSERIWVFHCRYSIRKKPRVIKSLHHNAESCIKWAGSTSDCFKVGMGVQQGGILSTDLYKLYINPLLDRLQDVGIGLRIGNIKVNNTASADDVALLSVQLSDAQIMVNMALDFANLEGYELQPKKSIAIHIRGNNKQCQTTNEKLIMGNITMPEVEQATHLGIIRTTTMNHNIQTNVDENITKARRSA